MKLDSKTKKIGGRALLFVMYIFFIALFFLTGRTHTILVDNKTDPEGKWQAINGMTVSLNGGEASEYMKGDRDMMVIKGQRVTVLVEFFDGRDPFKTSFSVPLREDTLLLSIPKLIAGIDPAFERFDIYGANRASPEPREKERFGQESDLSLEPEDLTVTGF